MKIRRLNILITFLFLCLQICSAQAQSEAVIPPSNRSTTSLEKNLLFFADTRFTVSQSGSASLSLAPLFDGNFQPQYSAPVNPANPYVILIENLPDVHVQAGAWIGWTTRYYNPVKFKVEVYNIYQGANTWITLDNQTNYQQGSYIFQLPNCAVGKIRFTFYQGNGPSGEVGLSELFFIHNEATTAYDNLMVKYNSAGNVGIGTYSPTEKLSVKGKIRAQEIKVESANWPDFVFARDYPLPSLEATEKRIRSSGHLPGIPSAKEVAENGVSLGEMNGLLLGKIEELTLHLIALKKQVERQNITQQRQGVLLKKQALLLKSKLKKI